MNRLKERRLELGLTQEAVSGVLKLVDPRIDTCMVSRFENGVCLPTEEVLTALEAALRTSRAYLYGDEDKADIPPTDGGNGAHCSADSPRAAKRHQPRRVGGGDADLRPDDAQGGQRSQAAGRDDLQRRRGILPDGGAGRPVPAVQAGHGAGYVHPKGQKADAGRAESGGPTGMRSVMQYWEPERPLDPKDYDMPVCPVCGEETDTFYKNKDGVIVGCEFCIETVDAWEEQK